MVEQFAAIGIETEHVTGVYMGCHRGSFARGDLFFIIPVAF